MPPRIMVMGNPKNHIELIYPSCSAVKPNWAPSVGKTPARMENENAVVMRAKQLPKNKVLRLI
jgi:hypothetical protein